MAAWGRWMFLGVRGGDKPLTSPEWFGCSALGMAWRYPEGKVVWVGADGCTTQHVQTTCTASVWERERVCPWDRGEV